MKKYVLAGVPNCGKTMLFNRLTGGKMRVANFPGITVEKKIGSLQNGDMLIDLPGSYSLNGFSPEEKVTENILRSNDYDVIINVMDCTCPEKSLPFTLQLLMLGKPLVIALNMADLCGKKGVTVDFSVMAQVLGVPVYPLSAKSGEGTDFPFYENAVLPPKTTFCSQKDIIDLCIKRTRKDNFFADRILLGKWAIPLFILIFVLLFSIVFSSPLNQLSSLLENIIFYVSENIFCPLLFKLGASMPITAFICEGIIPGVGTVLSFLPQMSALFFLTTALEDSGYMARAAFLMDKPLSHIGLSGKSFVPLLLGFGCTTSAMLSVRTVSSPRERILTSLALPFISCSARIPIYLLFGKTFFPGHASFFTFLMFLPGIAVMAISCLLLGGRKSDSFLLELPSLRMPSLKNIFTETRIRIQGFIIRAGTVIFLCSALMWCMQNIKVADFTLLNLLGRFVCPVFAPMGFDFPEAAAALLSGLFAKEAVVGTFAVLLGKAGVDGYFTTASAISFTVFAALYPPCVSALGVMRKEIGTLSTVFSFIYQLVSAYFCALVCFFLFSILRA